MSTTAQVTNAGLDLLRDLLVGARTPGTPSPIFIALGTGLGTITSTLTSGTPYTSIAVAGGLLAAIPASSSLTICQDGVTQVVSCPGGASLGATSVTVTSFTASATFTANAAALLITPAATDVALQTETYRQSVTSLANGASHGETNITLYLAPQNNQVMVAEVGWFAGNGVSGTTGSGTLIARAPYGHLHTYQESIQAVNDWLI